MFVYCKCKTGALKKELIAQQLINCYSFVIANVTDVICMQHHVGQIVENGYDITVIKRMCTLSDNFEKGRGISTAGLCRGVLTLYDCSFKT